MNQLRRNILIADDRPRHQLWEHGHIGAEGHDAPLRRGILPININGIAHGLKGKKGNADGQGQPQRGNGNAGDQGQVGGEEIPILEKAQQAQVQQYTLRHEPPGQSIPAAVLLYQHPVGIVDEDGQPHDPDIHRLAPAIEDQAGQQQHQIPPARRHGKIHGQCDGQKAEQKRQAAESHGLFTFFLCKVIVLESHSNTIF